MKKKPWPGCGRCDVCLQLARTAPDDDEHADEVVRKALCGVARIHRRFGLAAAVKLLKGAPDERLQRTGLEQTPTHGILADYPEEWLLRLLRRCVSAGWVDFEGGDRPLALVTAEGRAVIDGRRPARLLLPARTRARVAVRFPGHRLPSAGTDADLRVGDRRPAHVATGPGKLDPAGRYRLAVPASDAQHDELESGDRALFEALRAFRIAEARRQQVPPYVIASDRTLRDIAVLRPTSRAALELAHGIGPAKAQRYGAAILEIVQQTNVQQAK